MYQKKTTFVAFIASYLLISLLSSTLYAAIPTITPVDPQFSNNFIITSKLSGSQEVPAVVTNGQGVATIHFNADRTMATLNVTVSHLSSAVTGAHIHEAPAGMNGGVLLNFTNDFQNGRITATFAVDAALVSKLIRGALYLNIHTQNNPGGEIRGQLALEAPESFMGMLTGDQEVPAVTTTATGIISVHYTANTNVLEINAQWDGLSAAITGVHLHNAAAGMSGGVVQNLSSFVIGNSIKIKIQAGSYIEDLRAGNIYLNVHTSNNPGGEIRAQLHAQEGLIVDTWLTAAQEPHAVTGGENSIGLGFFQIAPTLDKMTYKVQLSGLSSTTTAAHLHNGALGIGGGVAQGLSISGNQAEGTDIPISGSLLSSILSGGIYVNIHTANNGAGEIRGQLYRLARDGYTYDICPKQEIPAPTGAAAVMGSGMFAFNRDMDEAHLMVTVNELSATFSGSHIHNAAEGATGGVIFNFTSNFNNGGAFLYFTDTSSTPFDASFASIIRAGNAYINIHTTANASGEVRGQIVKNIAVDCTTITCETDLMITGSISGLYQASNTMVTSGTTTTSGGSVTLKAGTSITLTSGFHAIGSIPFLATIEDCTAAFQTEPNMAIVSKKVEMPSGISTLHLFPNPTTSETTISYELPEVQPVFLAIYTTTGQIIKVLEKNVTRDSGQHQILVNVATMEAGMYIVLLKTTKFTNTGKLIVNLR